MLQIFRTSTDRRNDMVCAHNINIKTHMHYYFISIILPTNNYYRRIIVTLTRVDQYNNLYFYNNDDNNNVIFSRPRDSRWMLCHYYYTVV